METPLTHEAAGSAAAPARDPRRAAYEANKLLKRLKLHFCSQDRVHKKSVCLQSLLNSLLWWVKLLQKLLKH